MNRYIYIYIYISTFLTGLGMSCLKIASDVSFPHRLFTSGAPAVDTTAKSSNPLRLEACCFYFLRCGDGSCFFEDAAGAGRLEGRGKPETEDRETFMLGHYVTRAAPPGTPGTLGTPGTGRPGSRMTFTRNVREHRIKLLT